MFFIDERQGTWKDLGSTAVTNVKNNTPTIDNVKANLTSSNYYRSGNLTIGTNDVFATLSVTGCLKLHQLPRGLKVTVIDCQASGIRVIPNDIKCDRINLDSAAYITELPLFKHYIETINFLRDLCFKFTLSISVNFSTINYRL